MKIYLNILLALLALVGTSSCKKEKEVLQPSDIDVTYNVPQGSNAFDQTIVNYYEKYGSYLLYKFNERDAYWTPTGWKKPVVSAAGNWSVGADLIAAEESAIPAQLDLLDKSLFILYPQSFLKQFLPVKILLCSKVDSIYTAYVFNPTYTATKGVKKIPAYYNYDNISVNYGDATINQMTNAEKLAFLARVNQVFSKVSTNVRLLSLVRSSLIVQIIVLLTQPKQWPMVKELYQVIPRLLPQLAIGMPT
ncbi:hypothetical protein [Pedobacter sp. SL55]|uniref:hypothetical protein n=1 Tax=Pedobacter sp. SL55 TaxID=2995161 RepID=UPI00226EBADA|nr:hypothetical protein [Pedobacter sp. SL55]WAC41045.1 hypothetical protein OVA16_01315 [Pedobacter sp. SL55]